MYEEEEDEEERAGSDDEVFTMMENLFKVSFSRFAGTRETFEHAMCDTVRRVNDECPGLLPPVYSTITPDPDIERTWIYRDCNIVVNMALVPTEFLSGTATWKQWVEFLILPLAGEWIRSARSRGDSAEAQRIAEQLAGLHAEALTR